MFPIASHAHKIGDGHTLHFVVFKGKEFGYKGGVDFDGVYDWETGELLIEGRRWPVCFVGKRLDLDRLGNLPGQRDGDNEMMYMLCTSRDEGTTGYAHQHIHLYASEDGKNFKFVRTVAKGSAPWVYVEDGVNFFYYHLLEGGVHKIIGGDGLFGASRVLFESYVTYSAPSVMRWGDGYVMTLERQLDGVWTTIIVYMDNPLNPLAEGIPISSPQLFSQFLDDNKACCFLHRGCFGHEYITYSYKNNDTWEIWRACLIPEKRTRGRY